MFPLKNYHKSYRATDGELSAEQIENFRCKLGATNIVGFSWLLKPEASGEVSAIIPSVEDILYSEKYIKSENKQKEFEEMCTVSQKRVEEIQMLTIGQHSNEGWLICRLLRLTSSKFGFVLSACIRNS